MKTLLAVATVALAIVAFADGPKEGSKKRGPRGPMEGPSDPIVRLVTNPKMAEKIGLTKEQKDKIKEINKSSNGKELNKAFRASMEKQAELLKADKIDEAAVMAEVDKAYDIRKEMAKRQTKRIIQIKSILTPEQISKALEELKARQNREKGKGEAKDKAKSEGDKDVACRDDDKRDDVEDGPRKHVKPRKPREMPPNED